MTSRVRCTQPPLRVVWHSGQDSGAWTTCRVAFIRGRAKLRGRFRRGFFSCSGSFLRLAAGLCPASRPLDRFLQALHPVCRSPALASRNSRYHCQHGLSRLALVGPDCPFMPQPRLGRHVFQRDLGSLIRLINSEQLPKLANIDSLRGCW